MVKTEIVELAVQLSVYDKITPFCSIGCGGAHVKAMAVVSISTAKFSGGPLGAEKQKRFNTLYAAV